MKTYPYGHKQDIKNLTAEELGQKVASFGEPAYRTGQLLSWLYQKGMVDFDRMTNLSNSLKIKLQAEYYIGALELAGRLVSKDKTEKYLFKLEDGSFVESVLIKTARRRTVCLSTQVGCKFGCLFCASGKGGFVRNRTPSEITGQLLYLKDNLKISITNVVLMGMGEPLDNYANSIKAIKIINSPQGLKIAARRITISTCGIIPGIRKLKNEGLQVNLSLSLHAANDVLRDKLMPVNKKYKLKEIIKELEIYFKKTKRKITLEYILFKDLNDSSKDAEELARVAGRLKAKINLIKYHKISGITCRPAGKEEIDRFMKRLQNAGADVTLRVSKGVDINGACGQLAGKIKK